MTQLNLLARRIRQRSDGKIAASCCELAGDSGTARVRVGPFVLRERPRNGSSIGDGGELELLWCFACLAALDGEAPEVTLDECDELISFLSAELGGLGKSGVRGDGGNSGDPKSCCHVVLISALAATRALAGHDDDHDIGAPSSSTNVLLPPGHRVVHTSSLAASLSAAECHRVVQEAQAEATARGWSTKRHKAFPTTDLAVAAVPSLCDWLPQVITQRLLPEFERKFHLSCDDSCLECSHSSGSVVRRRLPSVPRPRKRLHILDLFVAKYEHRCVSATAAAAGGIGGAHGRQRLVLRGPPQRPQ